MSIDPKQLSHLCHLAALHTNQATETRLMNDLHAILDCADTLRRVELDDTKPLMHPLDITQRLRQDVAHVDDITEALSQIAPQFENNLYCVPKVIQ